MQQIGLMGWLCVCLTCGCNGSIVVMEVLRAIVSLAVKPDGRLSLNPSSVEKDTELTFFLISLATRSLINIYNYVVHTPYDTDDDTMLSIISQYK